MTTKELWEKYASFECEDEQGEWVLTLTKEEVDALESYYWEIKSTGETLSHLGRKFIIPPRRRLLISMGTGATAGTVAAVAGASLVSTLLAAAGGYLLANACLTVLEEDKATSALVQKGKAWVQKVMSVNQNSENQN